MTYKFILGNQADGNDDSSHHIQKFLENNSEDPNFNTLLEGLTGVS